MNSFVQLMPFFPSHLRLPLGHLPTTVGDTAEEIRLRVGRPLLIKAAGRDLFIGAAGLAAGAAGALLVSESEVAAFLESATLASLYAVEDQVRAGFLTLPGGHRVGLVGEVVMQSGEVATIKHISGCNIRIARAVIGAASTLLPRLVRQGKLLHTLVASPPGCGKTTILRDLVRTISNGAPEIGLPGMHVALADERSEIAACYKGVPGLDVGMRTDVLDKCPKALAVTMLLRAMGPQVIVTDEIGSSADAAALADALHSGVTLLASAHGSNLADISRRPGIAQLLAEGAFSRLVILSRRNGPGTVESVVDLSADNGLSPAVCVAGLAREIRC